MKKIMKSGLVCAWLLTEGDSLGTGNFSRQIRATLQLPMDFGAGYSQKKERKKSERRKERKVQLPCLTGAKGATTGRAQRTTRASANNDREPAVLPI